MSVLAPGNAKVPAWGPWNLTRALLQAIDAENNPESTRGYIRVTAHHVGALDKQRSLDRIPSIFGDFV